MNDRYKLLGKYHTPRFRYGAVVTCAIRGTVKIVGLTDARIPWPKCRTGKRARAIILYGKLAKAVRKESAKAVAYWFGVGMDAVWKWRKALGVDRVNEGTSALMSRNAPDTVQSEGAQSKLAGALKSPERAEKIATARRGKPRPASVREALRNANLGRKHSAEERQKRSESHKLRGTIPPAVKGPPWTAEEDALLGTMLDREVAQRIGRSEAAVSDRRYVLDVPAFTKRKPNANPVKWTQEKDALLGTMSDTDIAQKLRCTVMQVLWRRRSLGIPAFGRPNE